MAVPWPQKHDILAKISLKRQSAEIPTGLVDLVVAKNGDGAAEGGAVRHVARRCEM